MANGPSLTHTEDGIRNTEKPLCATASSSYFGPAESLIPDCILPLQSIAQEHLAVNRTRQPGFATRTLSLLSREHFQPHHEGTHLFSCHPEALADPENYIIALRSGISHQHRCSCLVWDSITGPVSHQALAGRVKSRLEQQSE